MIQSQNSYSDDNSFNISKLRIPLKYPVPYSRTKRYQSFLNYALAHFPDSKWTSVFYSLFYVANCVLCNVYFILCVLYCTICLYCSFLYYRIFNQSSFLAATVITNVCLVLSCLKHHLVLCQGIPQPQDASDVSVLLYYEK